MQLSLSSATLDSLPQPAPKSRGLPRSGADGTPSNASASDTKKRPGFDDLLTADPEKSKPAPARAGVARQSAPGDSPDPAPAPGVAPLDPAASPDLAALLAFMAGPVVNDTSPVTSPQFDPVPGDTISTVSAESIGPGDFSTAAPPALTPVTQPPGPSTPMMPADSIIPKSATPEPVAPTPRQTETTAPTAEVIVIAVPADGQIPRPPAGTTRSERRAPGATPTTALAPGANLAAPRTDLNRPEKIAPKLSLENFLSSSAEEVTSPDETLGTDVAKPSVTMAAVPFSHRQSTAPEFAALSTPSVTQVQASARESVSQIGETASLAHRAVDAVLSAAERVSGERTSVNLQFSLAGNDLAVRVEFRGGTVHATFRTDSPELRAALASEWTAAGSKITDASVRMAPPVFTSSHAGSSTNFSGEGAPQQRESTRESSATFSLHPPRGSRVSDSPSVDRTPLAPQRAALSTTLHLHTFA